MDGAIPTVSLNYFELYQLPVSFLIDEALLKREYYRLSREYHPDFYVSESEEKQQEVLEMSTLNTNAYNTLRDPNTRMAYVLSLYGVLTEESGNTLPQAFLMEMMELNEQLMELEMEETSENVDSVQKELERIARELDEKVTPFLQNVSGQSPEKISEMMAEVKDYYLKKKYLLRIQERLDKFAPR